jgi:hypothetical protein
MAKLAVLLHFVVAAAAVAVAAANDANAAFQVNFELGNLDGKKGEYGSFTLEVRYACELFCYCAWCSETRLHHVVLKR